MQRVTLHKAARVNGDGDYVLYWMMAYRRRHFNFALERAAFWATELRKPLLIIEPLACNYPWASHRIHAFVIDGMRDNQRNFGNSPATYIPVVETEPGHLRKIFKQLESRACLIVTDDYPAFEVPRWISAIVSSSRIAVEVVDSNGILPMREAPRLFKTAASFRRYMQNTTQAAVPLPDPLEGIELPKLRTVPFLQPTLTVPPTLDRTVGVVRGSRGGRSEAGRRLQAFLSGGGESSGLSPYLHFGHISSHEICRAIQRSGRGDRTRFLDQLTTWRELGFNMCVMAENYDRYDSLPEWARRTLQKHSRDERPILYTLDQLENAATHDDVWNSAQASLLTEGHIQNRLRMLWGKKILEWSPSPEEALHRMIHLNNKYALDGRDPNSYNGIFWILGRYDRPWGPERPIFGLVRYMSSRNTARKLRTR